MDRRHPSAPSFYEFFAGGGMARAGLGGGWRCLFANDFDPMKASVYASNWGTEDFVGGDVAKLTTGDIPGHADLAWASFPCQDLSLAGDNAGLGHSRSSIKTRSGTFWPFWGLIRKLANEGRAPRMVMLENVLGVLTSNEGRDFAAIGSALAASGYHFGAIVADAVHFVPQSRPRVFFLAVSGLMRVPDRLVDAGPAEHWHPKALKNAYARLSVAAKRNWIWWRLPLPSPRVATLTGMIEPDPLDVRWHSQEETARLLTMMSFANLAKVDQAKRLKKLIVGGVYRRTRPDGFGGRIQRAEVRFDGVSGCLRTPVGGSSRQVVLIVEGQRVRSRLLSSREAARLMGLPDSYVLPPRYNDAYHVAGDGVCPPVVAHLARKLIEPILFAQRPAQKLTAAE